MKILLVEDKAGMRDMLTRVLLREGFEVDAHGDAEGGIAALAHARYDLVLTDLKLPQQDGLAVLACARAQPDLPVVVMTAYGSIEGAVHAMREGAYDFITKPFDPDHLVWVLNKALKVGRLEAENRILRQTARHATAPLIVGDGPAIRDAIDKVQRVATTATSVLITGESGSGKELFAQLVHAASLRRGPFVAVNCAAVPGHLLESEFFGHEKGAFTGAESRRIGKFEMAHGGTLFLDEIGDMELTLQAKLLRVLQDGEVMRVGGDSPLPVDVRVVAATNQTLDARLRDGRFREDLYYRLSAFPVRVPPLRERVEDIPALAEHFMRRFAGELNRPACAVAPEAMAVLCAYPWPGNVRELQNCIERSMILCSGPTLTHVTPGEATASPPLSTGSGLIAIDRPLQAVAADALRHYESACIRQAMDAAGGNKARAAEILQVSYKTLLSKLKDYQIVPALHDP